MAEVDQARELWRMKRGRTSMLAKQPFWGELSLRLKLVPDDTLPTACTNGTVLKFNPAFTAPLSAAELEGLIAHEVFHAAYGHCWRIGGREMRRWNRAADMTANPLLLQDGFTLPEGALDGSSVVGKSVEEVYYGLPEEPPGDGSGGSDPGGCGGCEPPSASADGDADGVPDQNSEADWKQAVMAASHHAKQRGKVPAGIDRLVTQFENPACRDMVAAVMEWAQRAMREDYSMRRPDPRYIQQGFYLPMLYSEATPPIVAAVDTSGSIRQDILAQFEGAVQRLLDECRPESLTVISCDAKVHREVEYEPGDSVSGPYPGGGGTDFRPIFERVEEKGDALAGMVVLTDLEGTFPDKEPDYPVLWVVTDAGGSRTKPPFGESVWMD